jgi:hypothetical protein
MGINVFQKSGPGTYLVGTFNGLYDWRPGRGTSLDHFSGKLPQEVNAGSKPFGEELVSGYLLLGSGDEVCLDYNRGAISMDNDVKIPVMPSDILENSPMSWWNFSLEVHTGRIFKFLIADFYILIIPLMGLFGTILVVSGLVVWIKLYVRKNR